MKRKKIVLATLMMILLASVLTACGGQDPKTQQKNDPNSVSQVIEQQAEKGRGDETSTDAIPNTPTVTESTETPDIDLTTMSSTMVYSEVLNMMQSLNSYTGKIVKMHGTCAIYTDEQTGKSYAACIIKDATACCSQGLEFTLNPSLQCPQDYPAEGTEITVIGKFATYTEGEDRYITLTDAKLVS